MSSVLRVRDGNGATWFIKRHGDAARYRAELAAYRQWIPILQDAAPRLRASDDALHAVILSAAPGDAAPWPGANMHGSAVAGLAEQEIHRRAGRILRRLHDAQPPLPWPDFAASKIEQFGRLRPAATAILSRGELDRAARAVGALSTLPAPLRVPCHHDYTPRNWLVHDSAVCVLDFEWCGLDARVADFGRLHLAIWPDRLDLREAFLNGYGHALTATDQALLHGCAVLTATWLLVRAHDGGQPSFQEASRVSLLRIIGQAR